MKRLLVFIITIVVLLCFSSCKKNDAVDISSTESKGFAGMANPNLYGVSGKELLERTGIMFEKTENLSDISFNVIGYKTDDKIAEMTFAFGGKKYSYRVKPCADTMLYENDWVDETYGILPEYIKKATEKITVAGVYDNWKSITVTQVSYCEALLFTSEKNTVLCWLDVAPGMFYTLSTDSNCEKSDILSLAESIFTPVQGDVNGDIDDKTN